MEVTDRIDLHIQRNGNDRFEQAVREHAGHILAETLSITPVDQVLVDILPRSGEGVFQVELDEAMRCALSLRRSAN